MIHHAFETFLGADGNLHAHRVGAQADADLPDHAEEVGAGATHFIDEGHARA